MLATSLILYLMLVVLPYYEKYPAHSDPKWQAPFVWEGIGSILYPMAFVSWLFSAYAALPVALTQIGCLARGGAEVRKAERLIHVVIVLASITLSLFTLTEGTKFMLWLSD